MNPMDGMAMMMFDADDPAEVPNDTSYGHLAFLTLEATFQSMLICLLGYFAARGGLLPKSGQKLLSQLNVQIFTPCLIFAKMGSSLSLSALPDLVIIPILFAITLGVSYLCGRGVSRAMQFNKMESNFVTAMAVFGNSNSLPVSLTVSLAQTLPFLKWPDLPGDTTDGVTSRGLLYLLLFQQFGQIVRWTWGYNTLLAKPIGVAADERLQGLPLSQPDGPPSAAYSRTISTVDSPAPEQTAKGFLKAVAHEIWQFMNPPLWAMLLALVVASIEPLKNAIFIKEDSFLFLTFGKAVQKVAGVAIPLILLVLGSNFVPSREDPPPSANCSRIVFASLLSRMLLPALVLLPLIALGVKYLNISILDDPIFLVSSFILTVSPPAIQLAQITQLNGIFEGEMSRVLFWGYVVLTPPASVLIVVIALQVLRWTGITE